MLVAHLPRPPHRVSRPVGPVGENPQPGVPGVGRLRGHLGQHHQLGSRIDCWVRGRQRGNRHELEPAAFDVLVEAGEPVEILPQLTRIPVGDVSDPLAPRQTLGHVRSSDRGHCVVTAERPAHVVTGRPPDR